MLFSSSHTVFFKKLTWFVLTSGLGWTISTATLWSLVRFANAEPFWANWVGDFIAVTYVYLLSTHKIFQHDGKYLKTKFTVWLTYQFVIINLISIATSLITNLLVSNLILTDHSVAAVLSKAAVTPASLVINFFFAYFLLERCTYNHNTATYDR